MIIEELRKITDEGLAIQCRLEQLADQIARAIDCPPSEIDHACDDARSFALENGSIVARASVVQARRGIDFANSALQECERDLAASNISKAQAHEVVKVADELLRSSEELLGRAKVLIGPI
jgi:hypothetical protein